MGNPIRDRDPSLYRLITIRTVRGEMWLQPNGSNRRLIGGILARYQEIFGIEIYAYTVLSNHIHLIIRAPRGNTDEFAENVNREIARRINWRYRREGSLWGRRYSDQEVLDPESDLLEAFIYVTLNCTRHGLLRDAREWKGLHSYDQCLSESDRVFHFTHYSELNAEGVPRRTTHKLKLSVLPQFSALSKGRRKKKISKLLRERLELMWKERGNTPYLGQATIEEQAPGEVPHRMSRSPRPACYSKCSKLIREFMKARRLLLERFSEASMRFRLGRLYVQFPAHTFKPPMHRLPRISPFNEITSLDSISAA